MFGSKKAIIIFSILHLLWFLSSTTILNMIFGPTFLLVSGPNFSQNLMTHTLLGNGIMILFSALIGISIYKYAKINNKKKPILSAIVGLLLGFIYGFIYYFAYTKE
jgi:hypothetical protein